MIRSYSELKKLKTFKERYLYLKLKGTVGVETFGRHRYLNQTLYRSPEWKRVRDEVIIRDDACDLGILGYEIYDRIYIHHMNPITPKDLEENLDLVLDPEYLICTTFNTHNAIHYGDESLLPQLYVERKPGDTLLW
jgi:hypothetical protein